MSSYRVLAEVTKSLRDLLWDAFSKQAEIRALFESKDGIALTHPTDTKGDAGKRLSLWLYRIEENEFIKNQPLRRANGNESGLAVPPLALDLSYLVTPFTKNPESDLQLLGKTMQVFYENSIYVINEPDEPVQEELKIILGRISLEEITRIWEALNEPYRLSVCYRVRVTRLEADRLRGAAPIVESNRGYGSKAREGG